MSLITRSLKPPQGDYCKINGFKSPCGSSKGRKVVHWNIEGDMLENGRLTNDCPVLFRSIVKMLRVGAIKNALFLKQSQIAF